MNKRIVLITLLAFTAACFDDEGYRDPYSHVLAVTIGASCTKAPFGIYLDGREAPDRVAEIPEPGGRVLMVLTSGVYAVYVRDAEGAWIFEDDIQLRADKSIAVECSAEDVSGAGMGVRR